MLESKLPFYNRIRIDKDDYVSGFEKIRKNRWTCFVFLENIAQTYLISRRIAARTDELCDFRNIVIKSLEVRYYLVQIQIWRSDNKIHER